MLQGHPLIDQINRITVLPDSLAIWGLGQMGLVIKGPDAVLYIDPCLSETISERAFLPPMFPENIHHANYVLCSHEHIDHFDVHTLGPLLQASPQAKVITTRWCMAMIESLHLPSERVIFPTVLTPLSLPTTTCTITALPSAHYELEYDTERGYRWLGFLIEWNGVTVYFAGDTIIYDGYREMLKHLPHADIAVLPVNGRDYYRDTQEDLKGNLHPREAARLALEMEWDLVIVGHNDLLPRNTIPMGEIAQAFADECPQQAYKILKAGELLYYIK